MSVYLPIAEMSVSIAVLLAMGCAVGFLSGLLGVGGGLARPGFSGGASLSVRQEEQGGLAGLVVAINGAGFVFSPLTGVTLYEMAGLHAPLWLALGVLVSMSLFALLSRRLRSTGGVSSSPSGGAEAG